MKMNLLQLTQNILSALNSDEVNSISDTTESLQVANIIQTTYYNMLSRYDLPEHNQLFQLDASTVETQPVLMFKPEGISRIEWIKYFDANPYESNSMQSDQYGAYSQHDVNVDLRANASGWSTTSSSSVAIATGTAVFTVPSGLSISTGNSAYAASGGNTMSGTVASYSGSTLTLNITKTSGAGTFSSWTITQSNPQVYGPGYLDVEIIPLKKFLHRVNQFNLSNNNIETFTLTVPNIATGESQNYSFNYQTDGQPQYCTVIQNYYVIFDSYDSSIDSTLQSSKTEYFGWVLPSFQLTDSYIPQLDDQVFPLLLNESKSLAYLELKHQTHQKAEQEVQRQISTIQKYKSATKQDSDFDRFPNYGRHNKWL